MILLIENIRGGVTLFEHLTLNEISSFVILIGAVVVAIKNIYGFFKKPVESIQSRSNTREEQHIEEVIERRVPILLAKHSDDVRMERKIEDQAMMDQIKDSIGTMFDEKVEELKEISLDQGQEIKSIKKSVDLLNSSQMDMMRYNMNRIYYKYRPYRKILDCDKKAFLKFYTDYHEMGGNTWIDSLYPEVMRWETVENEEELKS